ncbi:unnamed protein product, partial [Tenebrio molitor]
EQSYCELLKHPNSVSLGVNNNEYGRPRSGLVKHHTNTRSVWNNNEYGRQRSGLVKHHTNTRSVWNNKYGRQRSGLRFSNKCEGYSYAQSGQMRVICQNWYILELHFRLGTPKSANGTLRCEWSTITRK